MYDTRFYRLFRQMLVWCLCHRKPVLLATLACFGISLFLMGFVKQEFFRRPYDRN